MSDPMPKPFERCYWVAPGRLLAGPYPGDWQESVARAKLAGLLEAGVRCVVALTEAGEVGRGGIPVTPYEPDLTALAEARGLSVTLARHAIPDMSVPTIAGMRQTLDTIDGHLVAGRAVYVHCWGGYGRTGTVVGCWLARHGLAAGPAVLERLRDLRQGLSGESPQTDAQRAMVTGWPAGA